METTITQPTAPSDCKRGEADQIRDSLRAAGVLAVRLCGNSGSGKTSLLEQTIQRLKPRLRCGVLVSHAAVGRDAQRLSRFAQVVLEVQIEDMAVQRVAELLKPALLNQIDLLFIEGAGGLAACDEVDWGQDANVAVFSVSGGDDKAAEFSNRVAGADLVILTKTDLLPHVPFDLDVFRNDVRSQNASVTLLELSALHGQGIQDWLTWLNTVKQRERPVRPSRANAKEGSASPEWFFG